MRKSEIQKLFLTIPARPHFTATGVYIDYYTPTPDGKRQRHVIRCNRLIKPLRNRYEKQRFLYKLCSDINCQLFGNSYNLTTNVPDAGPSTIQITVSDACKQFVTDKQKYLRPDTIRTYKSLCNRFLLSVDPGLSVADFSKKNALDFLDRITGVNNRSYNNYLKQCRAMFSFFCERDYATVNPFENIKPRRNTQKRRELITPNDRKRILEYCDRNIPYLSLVLMLVYSALIRPKEIRYIKISDVDMTTHQIRIRSEVAKNHNERYATFTQQITDKLNDLHIERYPADYYLIGRQNKPDKKQIADKRFLKDWYTVKAGLKLPAEYQLYSFRDTGITDLIKSGIDEIAVMQHADHSDLKITSIYARHKDKNLSSLIYSKAPKF